MGRIRIAILFITLQLSFIVVFNAQAEPVTFDCSYPLMANLDGIELAEEDFNLQFLVDPESDKAYMIGNVGTVEVIHLNNDLGVSFIEVTGTGNVMTTTITFGLVSVHSRHTIIPAGEKGELLPSQYYGICVKK